MEDLVTADVAEIPQIVEGVRNAFFTHKTKPIQYRVGQLNALKKLLEENKKAILDALYKDLHKSDSEGILMEYNMIMGDLTRALNRIQEWTAPQDVPKDILNKLNSVYMKAEPYGVVLCISPWNYPFQLVILPLIGIIAAGNCCVMKPSEGSVATSNLVTELIPKYLDNECYVVVPGEVDVSQALLKERYDYIFYTGSTQVGKIVMKHAAENLTPVTLELGGKSPVLVAPDANLRSAARRIIWGKCLNSGQTCIAPDYVICAGCDRDKLVAEMKKAAKEFYGKNPKESKDYGRVINDRHFKRLVGALEGTRGTVVHGGESDESVLYIAPTIVTDVSGDDKLMTEEIFGPILPVMSVSGVDEAVKFINKREKPLAFYVFTESSRTFQSINDRTSAGGVMRNDTLMYSAVDGLPFGGVGHSGMGSYHGKFSFDTFSHYKPVLETGTGMEFLNNVRYPPFSSATVNRLSWLLSPRTKSTFPWKLMITFILVAIVAALVQMYGVPVWLYRLTRKWW